MTCNQSHALIQFSCHGDIRIFYIYYAVHARPSFYPIFSVFGYFNVLGTTNRSMNRDCQNIFYQRGFSGYIVQYDLYASRAHPIS